MINPEYRQLLLDLKKTSYGVALKAFLDEELGNISDITTCETWEETLGRKYAIKLLNKLSSLMEEKKTTEKGKNQYV